MKNVLSTVQQRSKQPKINYLWDAQLETHVLLRTIKDMQIEHGETKDGINLEQDVRQILSKIRKMLKKISDIDN